MESEPKTRRVRVVAGLMWRGPRLLVQQRPVGKALALLWEFPGGKVEKDEPDEAALARECQEELGVAVEVGERLWETDHGYDHGHVELVVYVARMAADAEPQAHQAAQLCWLTPPELAALPFCAADVPLVALLIAGRFAPAD